MSCATVLEDAATLVGTKLRELNAVIDAACAAVRKREQEATVQLEPWLDKRTAAKFLAMSVSTLESRLSSRNAPPHTNDGGKLRFKPSELDAWMRQWAAHPRRGH